MQEYFQPYFHFFFKICLNSVLRHIVYVKYIYLHIVKNFCRLLTRTYSLPWGAAWTGQIQNWVFVLNIYFTKLYLWINIISKVKIKIIWFCCASKNVHWVGTIKWNGFKSIQMRLSHSLLFWGMEGGGLSLIDFFLFVWPIRG